MLYVNEPTPCADDWWPYDVLIQYEGSSPMWLSALEEATAMCRRCPVTAQCFAEFKGEPWVAPIRNRLAGKGALGGRRRPAQDKKADVEDGAPVTSLDDHRRAKKP